MHFAYYYYFFVLFRLSAALPRQTITITLPNGIIEGLAYTTANNVTYYGFRGIPYAEPPLDELRFEAPLPAKPWKGILDARKDGKNCISPNYTPQSNVESEDCLFINVYVPTLQPNASLPVLFWIHGGSFVSGSSRIEQYGPDLLVEKNVILISINYRLGALGFLSTADGAIPGNQGLKDQNLALKWVRDNVAYFGGDPDKVTIFGQSAGGKSVGLHLVSKLSTGLFRAAIPESGAALVPWAIDKDPKRTVTKFASHIAGGGDFANDTVGLREFLKQRPVEEIVKAQRATESIAPVIEVENAGAFLTQSPYRLLESGDFHRVPIMTGITAEEALLFFPDLASVRNLATLADTEPGFILPDDLFPNATDEEAVERKIRDIYLKGGNETFASHLASYANFFSDNNYTRGVIKQAELASSFVPVYFYQFSYYGRASHLLINGTEKASHCAELPFLFKHSTAYDSDEEDLLTEKRTTALWSNFAKYLNPTPNESSLFDNLTWPLFDTETYSYLNINTTLQIRQNPRDTYQKWTDIYESYGRKPFITY